VTIDSASSRRDRPGSARFATTVVAAATAAAVTRDDFAYRAPFDGLSGAERDAIGHGVLEALRERGRMTGDWQPYGWASNHTPWSYLDGAGAGLRASLDADAQRDGNRHPKDRRRASIERAAVAAFRGGGGARAAKIAALRANLELADPLPPDDVERIAEWACKRSKGAAHG